MEFRLVSMFHYAVTYYTKYGNIYAIAHIYPYLAHVQGYIHQMKLSILDIFHSVCDVYFRPWQNIYDGGWS